MNAYIPIDPSWSFKFFEFNRKAIGNIDNYFHFCDDFYGSAMKYIQTQINFNYGMTSATYNQGMSEAMSVCERYPELGSKIQEAFVLLYTDYRIAYNAMGYVVTGLKPIVEASGVLIGIVFDVNTAWPPAV